MTESERYLFYHAHTGPPYRCHGGSANQELAEELLDILSEDLITPPLLVASLDDPLDCCYRNPSHAVLIGHTHGD